MMRKRFSLSVLLSLLFLISSCTSFPADSSSGRTTEDILSSSGYDTDVMHPCQTITDTSDIHVNLNRGDYAWYYFKNISTSQAFGIVIVDAEPICLEPFKKQTIAFSPENREEIALTGSFDNGTKKYAFYDFYLANGEGIYFRVSPLTTRHLDSSLRIGPLKTLQDGIWDSDGNLFLSDLHVHELTFYTCDLDSRDYDPSLGHYHTCWKGDLSVFEEHVFGEPYEGEDGKTYSSCLYCDYRKEMDSSSSTNV